VASRGFQIQGNSTNVILPAWFASRAKKMVTERNRKYSEFVYAEGKRRNDGLDIRHSTLHSAQ